MLRVAGVAEIHGLSSRAELNGFRVTLLSWSEQRQRWAVQPDTGAAGLWVKPDNLMTLVTSWSEPTAEVTECLLHFFSAYETILGQWKRTRSEGSYELSGRLAPVSKSWAEQVREWRAGLRCVSITCDVGSLSPPGRGRVVFGSLSARVRSVAHCCKNLREFEIVGALTGAKIGAAGHGLRKALATLAKECPLLETVELPYLDVSQRPRVSGLMGAVGARLCCESAIDLSGLVADMASQCPMLERLRMHYHWLTTTQISQLGSLRNLAELDLSLERATQGEATDAGRDFSDPAAFERIAEGCPQLQVVDLSGNCLNDAVVCAFAAGCKHLVSVDFGYSCICDRLENQLTDVSAVALAEHCQSLVKVGLAESILTSDGLLALCNALGETIQDLNLEYVTCITDGVALKLAECCLSLKDLNLNHAKSLTELGAGAILQLCKDVNLQAYDCRHIGKEAVGRLDAEYSNEYGNRIWTLHGHDDDDISESHYLDTLFD